MQKTKKLSILGSTGSIGQNTIKVARHLNIDVVSLAAYSKGDLLIEQAKLLKPKVVAIVDEEEAKKVKLALPECEVVSGKEGLIRAATIEEADTVMSAIVGIAGLIPTIAAIKAKKKIALANKETLVTAGQYVTTLAKEMNVPIIPVDSEHSALFQALGNFCLSKVRRLILTASGGAFRNYTDEQLEKVSVEEALKHPNWVMGPKVTVDSSNGMNKGLEVIEAYWLFGQNLNLIDVVIHPQSIIHSLVEFQDFSILAQMGEPTMVTPIQYALTHPDRMPGLLKPFDFKKCSRLDFQEVDPIRFPGVEIAKKALLMGQSAPCYMNAANEVLVEKFLNGKISWKAISQKLQTLLDKHTPLPVENIDAIFAIDRQARMETLQSL